MIYTYTEFNMTPKIVLHYIVKSYCRSFQEYLTSSYVRHLSHQWTALVLVYYNVT